MGFRVLLIAPTPARAKAILKALTVLGELRVLFRIALAEDIRPDRMAEAVWLDGATGKPCRLTDIGPD